MEKIFYELIKRSQKIVEEAKKNAAMSENKVFWHINTVGSIKAYVFNKEMGIVSVEPCYDDYGGFALRLVYPAMKGIISAYIKHEKVSKVDMVSESFIEYSLELFKMKQSGWDITHAAWTHTYSGYHGLTYYSMQDAVNAAYTTDVFCAQPKACKP